MNKQPLDTARDADLRLSQQAMQRAAQRARELAAQTGTAIVVSRHGVLDCSTWTKKQKCNPLASMNRMRLTERSHDCIRCKGFKRSANPGTRAGCAVAHQGRNGIAGVSASPDLHGRNNRRGGLLIDSDGARSRSFCTVESARVFRASAGALTWPNGADFDPAWLYDKLSDGKSWSVPF